MKRVTQLFLLSTPLLVALLGWHVTRPSGSAILRTSPLAAQAAPQEGPPKALARPSLSRATALQRASYRIALARISEEERALVEAPFSVLDRADELATASGNEALARTVAAERTRVLATVARLSLDAASSTNSGE